MIGSKNAKKRMMKHMSEAKPAIEWQDEYTGQTRHGFIVNSAYCPVQDRWAILVMSEDGTFHNIKADGLGVGAVWYVETPDDPE